MSSRFASRARGHAAVAGLVLVAVFGFSFSAFQPRAPLQQAKVNRYIGAQKCKSCHAAKESGDQYTAWTHMKHAKAWESLASEDAKKIAAAKGIADPQKDDKCVECHVTGFGKPKEAFDRNFDSKLGIQCETCHGPGEQHMRARITAAGKEDEGDEKKAKYTQIPADEIIVAPQMSTCLGCHNDKSPSFKPFCFQRANAEVRHLNPLKPRTPEQLAAVTACGEGDKCTCKHGDDGCKCAVPDPKVNKK